MTRPETMSLVDCNIAIDTTGRTDWTYLTTSKTWVFSTPKEEKLEVICPNQLEQTVKISRTRQLVLNDNCFLKAHSFIIKESTKNLEEDKNLLPDFTLNATNLTHDKYSAAVTDQILLSITGKKLGTQSRWDLIQILNRALETNETVNQHLIFKWIIVTNRILTILLIIAISILTIWIIDDKTFHLPHSKKNNKIDSVTYTQAYEEHDNPGYAEIKRMYQHYSKYRHPQH